MNNESQWITTCAIGTAIAFHSDDELQHSLDRNWLLSPREIEANIAAIRRRAMIDGICLGFILLAIAYVAVEML